MPSAHNRFFPRVLLTAGLVVGNPLYAEILNTTASARPDNSLIVDIQVTTAGSAAKVGVTYQTLGVEPLISHFKPVSTAGTTIITIGRLRANRPYTYTVRAIDDRGGPAGTAKGSFTTGSLPAALAANTYMLHGRSTMPLVVLPHVETGFRGYVALDLRSPDAPQIVWYYNNAPSNASGKLQSDTINSIVQDRHGNFLIADAGSGPPPLAADTFYREITPDGTIVAESPFVCGLTSPTISPSPAGWIWGQGNDSLEQLVPGADGIPGTVLHLGQIVKDPFFDAGLAPQGSRLQSGIAIRRWHRWTGKDELVWDPFTFLDPLSERTDAANSDPGSNSNSRSPFPCAGNSLQAEEWMHSNSLQVAPTGVILMSVRHLDTVIAISPQFDRIAWRIGRFGSDFTFPNPSDRFYHEHYVRMLDDGNLLLLDNGNGRPAAEGGLYTRALELALDWDTMTAAKVWEYRHQVGASSGTSVYKYADKVGTAERLDNGNTIILFGADIEPASLQPKNPQTFTLVEADSSPQAAAVAVLDFQMPGATPVYRALPVNTLFGEVARASHQ
jgi:arylsulfotransferase ASST